MVKCALNDLDTVVVLPVVECSATIIGEVLVVSWDIGVNFAKKFPFLFV